MPECRTSTSALDAMAAMIEYLLPECKHHAMHQALVKAESSDSSLKGTQMGVLSKVGSRLADKDVGAVAAEVGDLFEQLVDGVAKRSGKQYRHLLSDDSE